MSQNTYENPVNLTFIKLSEDGILIGSFGVKDFGSTLVFLFFRKEEGIID